MATTRRSLMLDAMLLGGLALASSGCWWSAWLHKPETLHVYILVVPDEAVGGPAAHPHQPLTPPELQRAEEWLKRNVPKDRLKPTSIIVIHDEPASFLPNDTLIAHDPRGHRETILRVWTESDRIEWQSDRLFKIVKIDKAGPPAVTISDAPKDPFYSGMPYVGALVGEKDYKIQSSKLMASANNQQYKISLQVDDRVVDPDIICGSPPPGR